MIINATPRKSPIPRETAILTQFAVYVFLVAFICVHHAAAQTWSQLAPTGVAPSGRYEPSGVYDAATNQMIIFGGGSNTGDRNDLWALNLGANPQWTLLSPAGTPPAPRVGHKAVYDGTNARMIVFGGGLGNTSPCVSDIWVLANANSLSGTPSWTQLSPSGPVPAGRWVSSAIYDAASNRMTVFGGNNCFSGFYNDVWVLSNANGLGGTPAWTQLTPAGTAPSPSGYHSAVYDPSSNRMIVFGVLNAGAYSNQVWVLTNANGLGGTPTWIQLAPTGPGVPARLNHAAIYDALSNRMTIFGGGGNSEYNDTWVLSNANGLGGTPAWTQLNPAGVLPAAREGLPAVYDPAMNRMTIFGGINSPTLLNDVWVLTNANAAVALSVNRKVLNYGISGSLVTSPQTVLVTITGGANVAWTATSDHSNIMVSRASGIGTDTFQVTASPGSSGIVTVTAPGAANSPQTIQVNVATVTPAVPLGSFDTPITGTTGVVGAIPVTGWALDNIEVTRVDILREPIVGEAQGNLVFIGTAVFSVDSRPDVQGLFPAYPYQYRAGWGYQMLTNFLPNSSGSGALGNGTYKLHAIAFDKAGFQLDLGTKTITVDNAHAAKPFGTLDTPGQGGTISGSDSVNFGWALTPQPAIIPIDGSTITLVLDGVPTVHPVYNQFRSDIASLFPGYQNSMGAVGFIHLNTLTLANGVHTISWNVFDNVGRGEGIGSRYFNVLNTGGGGSVAAPEAPIDESVARDGVRVRHGLDVDRQPEPIAPDADGGYSVTMEEVARIELQLGAARGNMLVLGEAQALPTGSTLKSGVFYWQPGPGFLGKYTMEFERPDGAKIPVRVDIIPRRYE